MYTHVEKIIPTDSHFSGPVSTPQTQGLAPRHGCTPFCFWDGKSAKSMAGDLKTHEIFLGMAVVRCSSYLIYIYMEYIYIYGWNIEGQTP